MKRILFLMALISPIILRAQGNTPKENKIAVEILHPLNMHEIDFERGLAQHIKDYHKGDLAVNIFEVLTGKRRGEFHFVFRNHFSWTNIHSAFDAAGENSHSEDWTLNVGRHITNEIPLYIYEESDDSYKPSNPSDMKLDMLGLYLIDINIGMEEDFYAAIKKIKEMHQKNNSKNYYQILTNTFGEGNQVIVVFPLIKGWASFEPNPDEAWEKMFKAAFPKEDFKTWAKKFSSTQKSFESMVIKLRPDLSSPL